MKKKLNILCVIVMLVLAYPVVETTYYLSVGFNSGWKAVSFVEESEDKYNSLQKLQDIACMKYVYLIPNAFSPEKMMNESVINAKTGKKVPAMYNTLMVSVDVKGESPMFHNFVMTMINLLNLSMCIWAIVLFIKLILAINKLDIFSWKNVRRLHRIGLTLIASFTCTFLTKYLAYRSLREVFSIDGYELNLGTATDITLLVLGLCALIVGEVFSIGLKMKEEQELTI